MVGRLHSAGYSAIGRLQTQPEPTIQLPITAFRPIPDGPGSKRWLHTDCEQLYHPDLSEPPGKSIRRDHSGGGSDSTETEDYSYAELSESDESGGSDDDGEEPSGPCWRCGLSKGLYFDDIGSWLCWRCYYEKVICCNK